MLKAMDPVPPRILVVEDDPASQKVAIAMLNGLGYTVDIAASGRAAVAAAQRYAYAMIFLECHLPEGDGFWVARQIRAGGASSSSPMIALTMVDDAEACLRAGMDGHLRKPVGLPEIERVVREWRSESCYPES